jgi:hypothetical protein
MERVSKWTCSSIFALCMGGILGKSLCCIAEPHSSKFGYSRSGDTFANHTEKHPVC